jgi:hypothetical protein
MAQRTVSHASHVEIFLYRDLRDTWIYREERQRLTVQPGYVISLIFTGLIQSVELQGVNVRRSVSGGKDDCTENLRRLPLRYDELSMSVRLISSTRLVDPGALNSSFDI